MGTTIVSALNGLSYGMILFLIAAGLSLILGVMQFLNLAHGALFMLGGYIGWTVAVEHGGGFLVAVLVAGVAVAVLGLLLERLLLRRLHDQLDNQVLATLGITYIITNLTIWIWTAQPKVAFVPPVFDGSLQIAGQSYPTSRIAVLGAGLIVAVALWWFQDRTRVGAMLRAGMDDRETASSLGVNVAAVSAVVFTVGCFVAGLSGVLGQQLTGLQPGQGTSVLLLALVVLVLGGIGTVQGALLGAILIGLVTSFGQTLFPGVSAFLIYVAMILVLVVRPGGILGRPEALRI